MPLTPRPPAFEEKSIAMTDGVGITEEEEEPQPNTLPENRLLPEQQMSLKDVYEMYADASEKLSEETKAGINRFEQMRRELSSTEFKNELFRLVENKSEAGEEVTLQEEAEEATATEVVDE